MPMQNNDETSTSNGSLPKTEVWLNVELEVAPGHFVKMPINCPVNSHLKSLSKDQKMLFNMLLAKVAQAKVAKTEKSKASKLAVQPKSVKLSLWYKEPDPEEGHEPEGWAL